MFHTLTSHTPKFHTIVSAQCISTDRTLSHSVVESNLAGEAEVVWRAVELAEDGRLDGWIPHGALAEPVQSLGRGQAEEGAVTPREIHVHVGLHDDEG